MLSAIDYLNIVRDRGRRRLPLEDVYRQLFNPALYLLAYSKIGANTGALTPGTTDDTVDGMSLKRIQAIIGKLRTETYRWTPVRRIYIEKKHSTKKRPLGLPSWSDKLLQEVMRLILEAYYEPQFSPRSHGFRPGRGPGTALTEIYHTWKGTAWFIEGDISACFDSLDHTVLLAILAETIHDNRFLRLVKNLLKAGYLEDWRYHQTLSGTPQGGVLSPLLANIALDRLDTFVEHTLIPTFSRGTQRKANPAYRELVHAAAAARKRGHHDEARRLATLQRRLPSRDTHDPEYRKLRYIRYADDFLLGFTGPRTEAEDIKRQIGDFLRDTLKLELSARKTLLTHARTETARFLNYEVHTIQNDTKRTHGCRATNGVVHLRVPHDVVVDQCAKYMAHGKPVARHELVDDSVYTIVRQYATAFRGIVNYWRQAYNLHTLNRLRWVMHISLAKTVAQKLRLTVTQVWKRYRYDLNGRVVFRVQVDRPGQAPLVALFPDVDLQWAPGAALTPAPQRLGYQRTEVLQRLLADTCELCGSRDDVEVHHIRALKDLNRPGRKPRPAWVQVMAARRRKTLILCRICHMDVHAGRPRRQANQGTGEPCARKPASTVRRGADGKVPAAT